jgi:hypothetical protein
MDDADALDTSFDSICKDFNESQDLLGRSPAKKFYLENNRSMLSLITLLISTRNESGLQLLDVENDPWKTYPKKSIKPSLDALRAEIGHRWNTSLQQDGKAPASKHWDKDKMMKWLKEHPIELDDDLAFLKREFENKKSVALQASKDSKKEKQQLAALDATAKSKHKSWSERHPYLCLIHALVDHDSIKLAYIRHGELPSG